MSKSINFSQRHPFLFGFMLIAAAVLLLIGSMAAFSFWTKRGVLPWASPQLGVVHVRGVLADTRKLVRWLDRLESQKGVKGVLVRINSPGGVVAPAQELHAAIKGLAQKKPVVVSMGSLATSGGYYAAVGASTIFANPGTITGSIGVKAQLTNIQGLLHKLGIKDETIVSAPLKDAASMTRGLSKEERAYLQAMVDDLHDQFVRAVAKGRDMELDLVRSLADGRAYTGRQAKELGLVDGLGPMQQALEVLQHQARIGDDYQLLEGPKRETSILGWVLNALGLEAKAWTTGQPRWEFRYEYRP